MSFWFSPPPGTASARNPGPPTEVPDIAALRTIAQTAKGTAAILAISLNTILLTLVLCTCSIAKWLAPTASSRNAVRRFLARIAELWIACNNGILRLYRRPHWDIDIPPDLRPDGCYLVSCNHRSWVDILILQRCFNRRLPLLRFFLKRELIRVPFLGLAWWALDFPFVRRHSKAELAQRPELRGRDLQAAREACDKFRDIPVAMMNFPEGTRFTPGKRDRSASPYENLLLPRSGGMGQVLYALGDQLDALIDVTIAYPGRGRDAAAPSFWELLTGLIPRVVVHAQRREIPPELLGRDFLADPALRERLREWMGAVWLEKDRRLNGLLQVSSSTN